jgi:hypothetical protein
MRKSEGRDNAANKTKILTSCDKRVQPEMGVSLLPIFSRIQRLSMEFQIRACGIALE